MFCSIFFNCIMVYYIHYYFLVYCLDLFFNMYVFSILII